MRSCFVHGALAMASLTMSLDVTVTEGTGSFQGGRGSRDPARSAHETAVIHSEFGDLREAFSESSQDLLSGFTNYENHQSARCHILFLPQPLLLTGASLRLLRSGRLLLHLPCPGFRALHFLQCYFQQFQELGPGRSLCTVGAAGSETRPLLTHSHF